MDDHHVLITQLCDELDHNRRCLLDDRRVTHPLADRARAALAADGPAVPEGREPASVAMQPTPASSLVERAAFAISGGDPKDAVNWRPEARAAIREVAAWLRDRGGYPWAWIAQTLEQEANR